MASFQYRLLKGDLTRIPVVVDLSRLGDDERREGIRCPLCLWRPSDDSRWCCGGVDAPEPFAGCGTEWNTFSTHGECPGCGHRWRWTSCLICGEWSLHDDWYEEEPDE